MQVRGGAELEGAQEAFRQQIITCQQRNQMDQVFLIHPPDIIFVLGEEVFDFQGLRTATLSFVGNAGGVKDPRGGRHP